MSGAVGLADMIVPVSPRRQGLLGSGVAESCHRGSHHFAATKVHSIGFFFPPLQLFICSVLSVMSNDTSFYE